MIRIGVNLDLFVVSVFFYMYLKCGNVRSVRKVFEGMFRFDLVFWILLIVGYV